LLCCYYGLFASLLLLIAAPLLLGRKLREVTTWGGALVASGLALLLLSPVIQAQRAFADKHAFAYPAQWIDALSAHPADYLRAPEPQLSSVPAGIDGGRYAWPLSPGTLKWLFALVGAVIALRTRRRRPVALLLVAILVAGILLSLGPRWRCGNLSVYGILADYYPGFGRARNLFRFAVFVQLSVVLLATIGVHGLYVQVSRKAGPRRYPRLTAAVVVLTLIALGCETWPARPRLHALPDDATSARWVVWLRDLKQSNVCLAFLPVRTANTAEAAELTGRRMCYQTYHHRPMVNGYSSFVPERAHRLRQQLVGFPDGTSIAALRASDVTHVVIDQREHVAKSSPPAGVLVALDDRSAGVEIWELCPNP
jgi:hypothetical protein